MAYDYDVQKFTVNAILHKEIQCKKMDVNVLKAFLCDFVWNKVKYASGDV